MRLNDEKDDAQIHIEAGAYILNNGSKGDCEREKTNVKAKTEVNGQASGDSK